MSRAWDPLGFPLVLECLLIMCRSWVGIHVVEVYMGTASLSFLGVIASQEVFWPGLCNFCVHICYMCIPQVLREARGIGSVDLELLWTCLTMSVRNWIRIPCKSSVGLFLNHLPGPQGAFWWNLHSKLYLKWFCVMCLALVMIQLQAPVTISTNMCVPICSCL